MYATIVAVITAVAFVTAVAIVAAMVAAVVDDDVRVKVGQRPLNHIHLTYHGFF
jgi:hypothetical protein